MLTWQHSGATDHLDRIEFKLKTADFGWFGVFALCCKKITFSWLFSEQSVIEKTEKLHSTADLIADIIFRVWDIVVNKGGLW